jgi:hypothetical protein
VEITGVNIKDSEFLLSQYADDSSLILDDNPKSLEQSLFMLNKFSECAGLRVNFDKTEAIWLGSRRSFFQYHSKLNLEGLVKQ